MRSKPSRKKDSRLYLVFSSNLWPVAAYGVMAFWVVSSHFMSYESWLLLLPLNAVAHYTVTMSLAIVGTEWLGRRRTLLIVSVLIVTWEVFELWWFGMLLQNTLTDTSRFDYVSDTLDDIALGLAGLLTGAYFGAAKPSNTPDGLGRSHGI